MDVAIKAAVSLLIELLRYFQTRQDIQELVREEIRNAGLKSANDALGWKTDALGQLDGGATLTVKDGALQITIPGFVPEKGSVTITPEQQKGDPPK
jgi:hypothetical protein